MKKLNYLLIGTALILASCSQEEILAPNNPGGTANVTLTLSTGDMQTRDFAKGDNANHLQYAVYQVGEDDELTKVGDTGEVTNFYQKTSLSLKLVNGFSYKVVLWADASEGSPYSINLGDKEASLRVVYDNIYANNDALDAFYAVKELPQVNGDIEVSVVLKRPLSQINIGTNDIQEAAKMGYKVTQSSITVSDVPLSMNLLTGNVSDEQSVKFGEAEIPKLVETYPAGTGYNYLAMAYVLVGEDKATVDVEFTYTDGKKEGKRNVSAVPVQRNHRTNIYGQILTSNGKLNVELGSEFDDPANDVKLTWDGSTVTYPEINADEVIISQASDLAGLANMVNGTDNQSADNFEGKTIILANDFDMAGHDFPMIGASVRSNADAKDKVFKGTFDGNGKTIKNINIKYSESDENTIVGFISSIDGKDSELKNVTFENLVIEGGNAEQAGVVGTLTNGAKVSGVKVMSGNISAAEAAGGIVGRLMKNGTVENCENHASVSSPSKNVGGIVGAAYYTAVGETMKIDNCDNYGNVSGNYGVGGVVGLSCAEVTNCNNYGDKVIGKNASVGGVVGEQKATGKIIDCSNYAEIQAGEGGTTTYGAGGIVGWVRYTAEASYPKETLSTIVVSGCKNYGKNIKGATGVGGIVGTWYCDGECYNNINYAETISASGTFAAGIVGNSQWTEIDSNQNAASSSLKNLTVHDNISYTSLSDISDKGRCTHLFVYINDSKTTETNNTNPKVTTVSTDSDLQSALSSAQSGELIKLKPGTYQAFSYNSQSKYDKTNITIDANGAVFEGENKLYLNETTVIKNAVFRNFDKEDHIQGATNYGKCASWGYISGIFENCTFEGKSGMRYATVYGQAIFRNCKFSATNEHAAHVDSGTASLVRFENCTFSGYCPLGGSAIEKYELEGCTFETNATGFGGIGLRRNSIVKNCQFNIACDKDHNDIGLKDAKFTYEFVGCKVKGVALKSANLTIEADNITVNIDGVSETLSRKTPY